MIQALFGLRELGGVLLDECLCRIGSPWVGELLAKKALIFDIGANEGQKTSRFLSRGYRVLMVEPQPAMVKVLQSKFGKNSNAQIEQCAMGSRTGWARIYTSKNSPGISTLSKKWMAGRFCSSGNWRRAEAVRVKTLDYLIQKYGRPDWIKIDVEGFEEKVLAGLSRKVGIISFEYSKELLSSALLCFRRLKRLGYSKFTFATRGKNRFEAPCQNREKTLQIIKEKIIKGRSWGDIYAF